MGSLISKAHLVDASIDGKRITRVVIREVGKFVIPQSLITSQIYTSALEVVRLSTYRDGLMLLEPLNNVVALEPLSQDLQLEVSPKIGFGSIGLLLSWAATSGLMRNDLIAASHLSGDSLHEMLVSRFLNATEDIVRYGPIPRMKQETVLIDAIIGSVDLIRSTEHIFTRGEVAFYQDIPSRDYAHLATRVLLTALHRVVGVGLKVLSRNITDKATAILLEMPNVSPLATLSEALEITRDLTCRPTLDAARSYYRPALIAAEPILRSFVRNLSVESTKYSDFAMRLPMPSIFEDAVRNMTRAAVGAGAVAAKEKLHHLYGSKNSGPSFNPNLQPDIVVRQADNPNKCLMIIDVKYKDGPTANDHYQMFAYLTALDARVGVFVTIGEDLRSEGVSNQASTRDERVVYEYTLSAADLDRSVSNYIGWISSKVKNTFRH
jgi:5-methylcytosine-specific restriction endonuclease McrBC regulatory subunit McrC